MKQSEIKVYHVTGGQTPRSNMEALQALRDQGGPEHARVVHVGSTPPPYAPPSGVQRVLPPFGLGWLSRRRLDDFPQDPTRAVLHVWSPDALDWCAAVVQKITHCRPRDAGPRVVLDFDFPFDVNRSVDSLRLLIAACPTRVICPSEVFRRRLLNAGIEPEICKLIRDAIDPFVSDDEARAAVRESLNLAPDDSAILIPPPLTRAGGAFIAAWGVMLLAHARKGVHILALDGGCEAKRVARLARSCRFDDLHLASPSEYSLRELLAAADLAVYTPVRDAPIWGAALAAAAQLPLVVSDAAAAREIFGDDETVQFCRSNDPKDAARQMHQLLENPEQARRQARAAHKKACAACDKQRMLESYRIVYRELLGDRSFGGGFEIPLVG